MKNYDDQDVKDIHIGGVIAGTLGHQRPIKRNRIPRIPILIMVLFLLFVSTIKAQSFEFDVVISTDGPMIDTMVFEQAVLVIGRKEIILVLDATATSYGIIDYWELPSGYLCYSLNNDGGTVILYEGYILHTIPLVNANGQINIIRNKLFLK